MQRVQVRIGARQTKGGNLEPDHPPIGKGTLPPFDSGELEKQTDYEREALRECLAFRKATSASPSIPVPSNSSDEGSGTIGTPENDAGPSEALKAASNFPSLRQRSVLRESISSFRLWSVVGAKSSEVKVAPESWVSNVDPVSLTERSSEVATPLRTLVDPLVTVKEVLSAAVSSEPNDSPAVPATAVALKLSVPVAGPALSR